MTGPHKIQPRTEDTQARYGNEGCVFKMLSPNINKKSFFHCATPQSNKVRALVGICDRGHCILIGEIICNNPNGLGEFD